MPKIERIFLIAVFIFVFPILAGAQTAVNYSFLEVIDSDNRPVEGATVRSIGCFETGQKTNQKGQLERGIPFCYGDYNTEKYIISKDGYFTFEEIRIPGGLAALFSGIYPNNRDGIKIELLKIPVTEAERKRIGTEQLERELFLDIKYGNTDKVIKLLKGGVSPNLSTSDLRGANVPPNIPVILYAAGFGDNKTIKALLDAGADIRKKDSPARRILLVYLGNNFESLRYSRFGPRLTGEESSKIAAYIENGVDILIKAGADPEARDKDGNSLLINALSHQDIDIFKKILALDFSQKTKSEALRYLIHWFNPSDKNALDFAALLFKAGADPNFTAENVYYHPGFEGCASLLMICARTGKTDFVKLLLANKSSVNLKCRDGKTALIAAITGRQPEIAKILFDAGADGSGVFGIHHRNALMVAAENGYQEIVKTLIDKGLAIKERDGWHESALEIAIQNKAGKEMIEFLLKNGANPNGQNAPYCTVPLLYQNAYANPDILRLLIAYKADVNLSCWNDHTPVVYAARNGEPEGVKILLENGADITGERGRLALKYVRENLNSQYPVVKSRAEQILKILEAAGAK